MLEDLVIRNLAVIAEAHLAPGPGLTVISGSTGGGKSLLVAALKLLRGERAPAGLVRAGARECRVDGSFRLSAGERSAAARDLVCSLLGEAPEEDQLVLSRCIDAAGRSRAFICGRPVPLATLNQVGAFLLEIHGQGESAMLMRPAMQAEMLDHFAGLGTLRARFAKALARARSAASALEERARDRREREERRGRLAFQVAELAALAPRAGELERLEGERKVAVHRERLRALLGEAVERLSEGEQPLLEGLGAARAAIEEAARLDPRLEGAAGALAEAELQARDAAGELLSRAGDLEADPGRLEALEERIAGLRSAMTRHGRDEAGLQELHEELSAELERVEDLERGGEALAAELAGAIAEAGRSGRELVERRRSAGRKLCRALERDLADLGMEKARLEVAVGEAGDEELLEGASALGPGPVTFHLQANPGEEARPLARVASGGERARVMLALKRRLADADTVPVLVLDEIDAEVGGRLGAALGRKLREVSASHQVLCVTHLPQVAAFGETHIVVAKQVEGERTFARVEAVEGAARDRELAAMSRGEALSPADLAEARRLLEEAGGGRNI